MRHAASGALLDVASGHVPLADTPVAVAPLPLPHLLPLLLHPLSQRDPAKRPSAEQALKHPWLRQFDASASGTSATSSTASVDGGSNGGGAATTDGNGSAASRSGGGGGVSGSGRPLSDSLVQRLQRFVSRLAAAVHAADPRALVTVGSHSPPYCSDAQVGVAREQGVMDAGIALLH